MIEERELHDFFQPGFDEEITSGNFDGVAEEAFVASSGRAVERFSDPFFVRVVGDESEGFFFAGADGRWDWGLVNQVAKFEADFF